MVSNNQNYLKIISKLSFVNHSQKSSGIFLEF